MKRSAVAAVALVGASVLTGSAVVPGSATSAAPEMHTKRLVLGQSKERDVGKFTFVGSDIVRSRASGDVVGFDSITGRFYPKKQRFVVQIGLALKGGIIVGRVSGGESREFDGRILKGSGKYSGVQGTIHGRFTRERVHLTLRYHL